MRIKTLICTALFTILYGFSALAAGSQAQIIRFAQDISEDSVIDLTSTKVITDEFSFKVPEEWKNSCVLVPSENSYEIYAKEAYEDDGSGLLFSIYCYEDADLEDLKGCSILGFCGNKTYILAAHYTDSGDDVSEPVISGCEDAARILKKSFVSYVTE